MRDFWHIDSADILTRHCHQYPINLRNVKMWKYRFVTLPSSKSQNWHFTWFVLYHQSLHVSLRQISASIILVRFKELMKHYLRDFVRWKNLDKSLFPIFAWISQHPDHLDYQPHLGHQHLDHADHQYHLQGVGKLKKNPEELGRIVKNHLVYIIMMVMMILVTIMVTLVQAMMTRIKW